MRRSVITTLAGATILSACTTAAPRAPAPAGGLSAPSAEARTDLDLFVDRVPAFSEAQLVFVGRDEPGQVSQWAGAVFVPLSTFSVERNGIPNELPPAETLTELLEAAGVRGERIVIVGDPVPAGRAWAAFDYLGLGERAALFEGGPAAMGTPPAGVSVAAGRGDLDDVDVRDDMIVDAAWVHSRLADPKVVVLDARPPAEFSGETPGEGIDRPGHIPGARNVFWQTLVQSPERPRLKDEAELRRVFQEAGVDPGDTIVAYCRTGGQASFLYTVARHLGYDVRLYDGSFIDWSRTSYPVER